MVLVDPFVRIEDLHFFFGPSWDQDGLDDIVIMPKDSNYTLPFTVVVEANINGVTFSNEIEFVPKSFVIDASLSPEAITSGEQSYFYVNVSTLCSGLPFETRINIEIIKGQKYGSLIDPYTNERTKILTNLDHWFGNIWVNYIADSTPTNEADSVIFKVTTTDPAIAPKEGVLIIKPPQIYVYTEPGVVGAADTANVIIKHRLEDGTLENFPPEQKFELAVLDGCINGNILVGDSVGVYFENALQPIKFVTADSMEGDSGLVRLRVGSDMGDATMQAMLKNVKQDNETTEKQKKLSEHRVGYEKMIERKRAELNLTNLSLNAQVQGNSSINEVCYIGDYLYQTGYWEGDVVVVKQENEIMLGETKYFGVKKKTETGELKIEEIKTVYGEEPKFPADADGWEWQKTDVWGGTPIENLGTKSGVYWEKKWFDKTDNKNKDFSEQGLIRLIGRFWELGKEDSFKVKLKTINNDIIDIKVTKPYKLGNKYNTSKDVYNKSISIDSICIKYGGEAGIPPQFIKGQIENEAPGFFPPYRYEPISTELNNRNISGEIVSKKWKNSPFFVTENSMGSGGVVPTHYNLKYISYFTTPTKVWDILKKYSQIEDDNPSGDITLFCKKENGKLNFKKYGYKTAQKEYDKILMHFQGVKSNPAEEDYIAARDSTVKYFKYYWYGGLDRMYAQTRIFASYGLLQTMYETALNRGYKNDSSHLPEDLSINDIACPLTIKHLIKLLSEVLVENNNNNWVFGYENIFKAMAKKWNPYMTNYDLDALNNSKKYLPTNKN